MLFNKKSFLFLFVILLSILSTKFSYAQDSDPFDKIDESKITEQYIDSKLC